MYANHYSISALDSAVFNLNWQKNWRALSTGHLQTYCSNSTSQFLSLISALSAVNNFGTNWKQLLFLCKSLEERHCHQRALFKGIKICTVYHLPAEKAQMLTLCRCVLKHFIPEHYLKRSTADWTQNNPSELLWMSHNISSAGLLQSAIQPSGGKRAGSQGILIPVSQFLNDETWSCSSFTTHLTDTLTQK